MFAECGVLNYQTYLAGAIFIVLVPGPDTLSVLKNSVSSGTKGDCLAACGVFIGDVVLMFLVWAGVATLVKIIPILFGIIHYLGAFCLLYLGGKVLYTTLRGKGSEAKFNESQYGVTFRCVLILSLTNPKAILFYVSFFVQSIDANAPRTEISSFILVATLELVGFCYSSSLIVLSVFVTQYIRIKRKLAKVGNSLIGLMFVGFAARLATLQS